MASETDAVIELSPSQPEAIQDSLLPPETREEPAFISRRRTSKIFPSKSNKPKISASHHSRKRQQEPLPGTTVHSLGESTKAQETPDKRAAILVIDENMKRGKKPYFGPEVFDRGTYKPEWQIDRSVPIIHAEMEPAKVHVLPGILPKSPAAPVLDPSMEETRGGQEVTDISR